MSAAPIMRSRRLTWRPRVLEQDALAPLRLGLAILAACLAAFAAYFLLFGLADHMGIGGASYPERGRLWETAVSAVLIGYLPIVTALGVRDALDDVRALRPLLRANDAQFAALLENARGFEGAGRAAVALLAVSLGVLSALGADEAAVLFSSGARGAALVSWDFLRVTVLAWCVARTAFFDLSLTRLYGEIARSWTRVDLFDTRAFRLFTRRALRSTLRWVGACVIFSFFAFDPWRAIADPVVLLGLMGIGLSAVWPVVAARFAIAAARQAELARVGTALMRARAEVASAQPQTETLANRIANLLAYEERIASVRESPFDASNVLQLLLYVAVGLGCWLGSALVERLVASAFG